MSFDFLKSEKTKALFWQFVKFGIVGVSNVAVYYVINVAFLWLCQAMSFSQRAQYLVANTVAFLISVLWSFFWNNRYVFAEHRKQGKKELAIALGKTYLAYAATGILLANVLSYLWIERLGISAYIAPLLNSVINVPLNYVIVKLWAFGDHNKGSPTEQ